MAFLRAEAFLLRSFPCIPMAIGARCPSNRTHTATRMGTERNNQPLLDNHIVIRSSYVSEIRVTFIEQFNIYNFKKVKVVYKKVYIKTYMYRYSLGTHYY